jgi:hypothetical protein
MLAVGLARLVAAVASAVVVASAGCGSVKPDTADGGGPIDAGVDASTLVRACDPDRPMASAPTTEGSMQGRWHVSWVCTKGCALRRPGLTYSPELEVVGSTLLWSNDTCPDCRAMFFGEQTIDGCIDVTASADFDSQCRFSYRICEVDGELRGTVTWKEPGMLSAMSWTLLGRRS